MVDQTTSWKSRVILGLDFDIVPDESHGFARLAIRVLRIAIERDENGSFQSHRWQCRSNGAVVVIVRQNLERGARGPWTLVAFIGTPMNPRFLPQDQSSREDRCGSLVPAK
jgi:hypothetical protein